MKVITNGLKATYLSLPASNVIAVIGINKNTNHPGCHKLHTKPNIINTTKLINGDIAINFARPFTFNRIADIGINKNDIQEYSYASKPIPMAKNNINAINGLKATNLLFI